MLQTSTEPWWSRRAHPSVLLMANGSPAPQSRQFRGEHLSTAHKGSSCSASQGRSWNVAGRYGHSRSTDRQGGTSAMREHTSVFTFVSGKVGLTPWLFLAWYTEFCLCLMLLRSSKNAKASQYGDSSGSAPWPWPSSSYTRGRHLRDSWVACTGGYLQKERWVFFDRCHVHPSFSFHGWLMGL